MAVGDIYYRTGNYFVRFASDGTVLASNRIPYATSGFSATPGLPKMAHDGQFLWTHGPVGSNSPLIKLDPDTLNYLATIDSDIGVIPDEGLATQVAVNATGQLVVGPAVESFYHVGLFDHDGVLTSDRYLSGQNAFPSETFHSDVAPGKGILLTLATTSSANFPTGALLAYDVVAGTIADLSSAVQLPSGIYASNLTASRGVAAKADGGWWISWRGNGAPADAVFSEHDSSGVLVQTIALPNASPEYYSWSGVIAVDLDDNLLVFTERDTDTDFSLRLFRLAKTTGSLITLVASMPDDSGNISGNPRGYTCLHSQRPSAGTAGYVGTRVRFS